MTTEPVGEQIQRRGRGTGPGDEATAGRDVRPVTWQDLSERLVSGEGTSWLSVRSSSGVHTRPVFAAWTGRSFVLTTKATAIKTRNLDADGRVSLAIDLDTTHLVVQGTAVRVSDPGGLERAVTAMREVYDWPAEVVGEEVDAPYAAPTSGGPPFRVYEIEPRTAHAFPTTERHEPTRFTW